MLRIPLKMMPNTVKTIVRMPKLQILFAAPRRAKSTIKDSVSPVLSSGASPASPAASPAVSLVSPPPKPTANAPTPTKAAQVPLTPTTPKPTGTPSSSSTEPNPSVGTKATLKLTPPPRPFQGPPHKASKKSHRFRNFVLGLTLLTGGSFGVGVFYSLKSDNVHDFFTEYVPFGEEAVLCFEEQEFRQHFPNALSRLAPIGDVSKVKIPKSSGATWRLASDEKEAPRTTDVGKDGPHLSTKKGEEVRIAREKREEAQKKFVPAELQATAKVINRTPAPPSKDVKAVENIDKSGVKVPVKSSPAGTPLATLSLPEALDPAITELVNAVNGIIAAVNASGAASEYTSIIDAAKSELSKLNDQIASLKSSLEKTAAEKDLEFTKVAQGLLINVNNELVDMESKWRDEFDTERTRIANGYREKLQTELARAQQLAEQRLHNELLEQAIELKRSWIASIADRVEHERTGRLGRLNELSSAVAELEELCTGWTSVIDSSLKTQQLFTALEAMRAAMVSDVPCQFVRELAALREVADGDEIVRVAIASINPAAYQEGILGAPALVEKFRNVSREVRKAALLPEDAGVAAHAANWVLSRFMFRKAPVGAGQGGDDVESILARTEGFLEAGNVDGAARELNQLRGWARTLAKDWLREAKKLLEVEQALEVISAEARVQNLRVGGNQTDGR